MLVKCFGLGFSSRGQGKIVATTAGIQDIRRYVMSPTQTRFRAPLSHMRWTASTRSLPPRRSEPR
jgi:hypothetical protein